MTVSAFFVCEVRSSAAAAAWGHNDGSGSTTTMPRPHPIRNCPRAKSFKERERRRFAGRTRRRDGREDESQRQGNRRVRNAKAPYIEIYLAWRKVTAIRICQYALLQCLLVLATEEIKVCNPSQHFVYFCEHSTNKQTITMMWRNIFGMVFVKNYFSTFRSL